MFDCPQFVVPIVNELIPSPKQNCFDVVQACLCVSVSKTYFVSFFVFTFFKGDWRLNGKHLVLGLPF